MKLQKIDGMQSNWEGLWWHPESNYFSSRSINLSELRKFKGAVRMYVKKNRIFNNKGNNRPNYNFILRSVDLDANPLEITRVEAEREVAQVMYHHWDDGIVEYEEWTCGNCDKLISINPKWDYCPYCGSELDH